MAIFPLSWASAGWLLRSGSGTTVRFKSYARSVSAARSRSFRYDAEDHEEGIRPIQDRRGEHDGNVEWKRARAASGRCPKGGLRGLWTDTQSYAEGAKSSYLRR